MTKQEYYNLLIKSSEDGTFPSVNAKGNCYYRLNEKAECNKRCAVGLLIPDENYASILENEKPHYLNVLNCIQLPNGLTIDDLESVQLAHDIEAGKEKWSVEDFRHRLNELPCFESVEK